MPKSAAAVNRSLATAVIQGNNSFDLAKLLDPFEQIEREFNWKKEVAAAAAAAAAASNNVSQPLASPIKPPSEFGSFSLDSSERQDQDTSAEVNVTQSDEVKSFASDSRNLSDNPVTTGEKCNNIDIYDVVPASTNRQELLDDQQNNDPSQR